MPLGRGDNVGFLYDRGGHNRLGQFDGVIEIHWQRALGAISEASVTVNTLAPDCCDFLGQVRAVMHELVIFRDGIRVWEGPIIQVQYNRDSVTVVARDGLWWLSRRVTRGRFSDPANGVDEAMAAIHAAFTYDNPHFDGYAVGHPGHAPTITTRYNRADCTYYDVLEDYKTKGVQHTTIGRAIHVFPAVTALGQTVVLRSGQDITGDMSIIEDGLSLATRVVAAGGETFGATTEEPVVINYSTSPSIEQVLGWSLPSPFFTGVRTHKDPGDSWASGNYIGWAWTVWPHVPTAMRTRPTAPKAPRLGPKGNDTTAQWEARQDAYHAAKDDYEQAKDAYEADLKAWQAENDTFHKAARVYNHQVSLLNNTEMLARTTQKLSVHEGELISATMMAKSVPGGAPKGGHPGKLGLRLVGYDEDGEIADRAFEEGPPIRLSVDTAKELFVAGTVPKNVVACAIEVYRDTHTKWYENDGWVFDKLWWGRGRIETWFDGDTKDTSHFTYSWRGAPDTSSSQRSLDLNDGYLNTYYGLVEQLVDSTSTSRVRLESVADQNLKHMYPAPLAVDIPQNAPLTSDAPVLISELVAGTQVPVTIATVCRAVTASTILNTLDVVQDKDGEHVTVTLVAGQVLETDDPGDVGLFDLPVTSYEAPIVAVERLNLDGWRTPVAEGEEPDDQ